MNEIKSDFQNLSKDTIGFLFGALAKENWPKMSYFQNFLKIHRKVLFIKQVSYPPKGEVGDKRGFSFLDPSSIVLHPTSTKWLFWGANKCVC